MYTTTTYGTYGQLRNRKKKKIAFELLLCWYFSLVFFPFLFVYEQNEFACFHFQIVFFSLQVKSSLH